jgi:hypothetical protein
MSYRQQQIEDERDELAARLDKMRAFMSEPDRASTTAQFRALPEDEQDDMLEQLTHMEAYEAVLARRIERFGVASEPART